MQRKKVHQCRERKFISAEKESSSVQRKKAHQCREKESSSVRRERSSSVQRERKFISAEKEVLNVMGLFKKFLKAFWTCLPIRRHGKKNTASQEGAERASPSPFIRIPSAINPLYDDDLSTDSSFSSSESSDVYCLVSSYTPAGSSASVPTEVVPTEPPAATCSASTIDTEYSTYASTTEEATATSNAAVTDSPFPVGVEDIAEESSVISDSAASVDAQETSPSPSASTEATATQVPRELATPFVMLFNSFPSVESLAPIPSKCASQISLSPSGQSLRLLLQLARPPRFSATDVSPSPSVQSLVVHTSAGVSQSRSLECMHR